MRGLLLDYGGVLTTSETDAIAGFCRRRGVDFDWMNGLISGAYEPGAPDGPIQQVERGEIGVRELERWLAETITGHVGQWVEPKGLKEDLFRDCVPDGRMLGVVRRARAAGVRTALVSNSWGGEESGLHEQEEMENLFDSLVISGMVGARKPEPKIYLLALERIGVAPSDCVFVDDLPACVKGARAAGMAGIVHSRLDKTVAELERLLGVALG